MTLPNRESEQNRPAIALEKGLGIHLIRLQTDGSFAEEVL